MHGEEANYKKSLICFLFEGVLELFPEFLKDRVVNFRTCIVKFINTHFLLASLFYTKHAKEFFKL